MSGVTVPTTIMSSSPGAIPAISSALRDAAVAMSLVASSGAAMRRAPIPVRSRIQASLVLMPNSFTRSSFVTLRAGRYVPVPTMRERCMCFSAKRRGRLQRIRAASRRSALRKKLLAAPRRRGEVLLKMLLRERFGSGQRVQDRAVCRAPVRDHRDPLDPEQGSAAHLLVIDTLLHLLQLRFDQKSTGARHSAGLDLALEELSECPDGALRRLQQHVAGEPVGRDHVEQSGEDILALDVAGERYPAFGLAQGRCDGARQFGPLSFFLPVRDHADLRVKDAEHASRVDLAHQRELGDLQRRALDVGSHVDEHGPAGAAESRQRAADARPVDVVEPPEHEQRAGQHRPGVSRGDHGRSLAGLAQIEADAHRAVLLAPQGLAGVLVHLHHFRGVADPQLFFARAEPLQFGAQPRFVPDEQDLQAPLPMRAQGTLDGRCGREVPAHGVECDHGYRPKHRRIPAPSARERLLLRAGLYLLAAILAALRAGAVRQNRLAAVGASADVGSCGLPMRAPLVALLAAGSLLRDAHSLLLLLQLDALQGGPARIRDGAVAAALAFVEVLAASGAEAEAVLAAERRGGNLEKDLLAEGRSEIELLAGVSLLVDEAGIEAAFSIVGAVLFALVHGLGFGDVGADQLGGFFDAYGVQAPLARTGQRNAEFRLDQHLAAHLGGGSAQMRCAGGVELGGRIGAQDTVEKFTRQVRLEGLVCLFEGIHIENQIGHGRPGRAAY